MKKLFTLLLLSTLAISNSYSQSTTVVISQVYSGGGSGNASVTYKYDYVELYNKSATSQDISDFSLQYGSGTGQFGNSTSAIFVFPSGTVIPAGKYLLVQLATAGTAGAELPTPDFVTTNLTMGAANGKVLLANQAAAVGCGATATPCTLPSSAIVDLVSWGSANNAEGGAAVAALSVSTGAVRKQDGALDTDNNAADFDVITDPVPRNSSYIAPLTLTSFTASAINGKAQLNWKTADEINVAGFDIEKSTNGTEFTKVGFVSANNEKVNSYSFTNEFSGIVYYRLKMNDKDGSYKYSRVVSLNGKQTVKLDIYPNPVRNTATLSHEKVTDKAVLRITTLDGRTVLTSYVQAGATQTTIDVSKLLSGNYIAVFESNGNRSSVQFIKQ